MRFRRRRPRTPPPPTSLDCSDGMHLACIPTLAPAGPCGCTCHQAGDPVTRTIRTAGLTPDPGARRGRWDEDPYAGGGDC